MDDEEDHGSGTAVCPNCGTAFAGAAATLEQAGVDRTVRVWFTEQTWDTAGTTRQAYAQYLVENGGEAVGRARFVADLARLGVVERPGPEGVNVLVCP
ncbi:hypothetical protein MO973_38315 [Paenibacillus sp. TRM 82003]|uniref:hypothetical protein n=1 Tax=Kineococcus sp. TRM81007 TaxID=2925831 RepID=UPI001F5AE798|nr:hypothetical protein [Kineococcus sp. TRM81007]MCI2238046.1 hypothetical protein [Kineococcus sp. TRM81007]MCI3926061.1 hypothetical protein [Paenibacillus sp. TRM 82003]